jgi:DNA invertase Pin-like site-specific DNA recombinase
MSRKSVTPALAYLRTSSPTNVGPDKDSEHRQRWAIQGFAQRAGYELVGEFYDAAVRGADDIDARPGFAAMLERIEANGARTIIVETAYRFARDLMVQEVGYRKLRERGIELIAADSPSSLIDDGPTATLVRQVLGAIAQFDKAMTVAKLRGARDRIRREQGKCEGRKTRLERIKTDPEAVQKLVEAAALAKRLHRASPKTGKHRSLREISQQLEAAGFLNEQGRPYHAESVKRMIEG